MALWSSAPVRFGLFEFDPPSGELRKRGLRVRLTPQAKILLRMLLEPPLRTRTRAEIQQRLWSSDTFVDFERAMNKVVHSLRNALGETARNPHFIETAASEGYRFVPQFVEQDPKARPARSRNGVEWLAVLPIVVEPESELVTLGKRTASCLTERLARVPGIRVMAESTVNSYALEGLSPRQAGEDLGVCAVLSGEMTLENAEVCLRMELIDATDGALLSGAYVECAPHAGPHVEGELAQGILDQILERPAAARRTKKGPKPVPVAMQEMQIS